jgi:ATP-dependent DNA ligase
LLDGLHPCLQLVEQTADLELAQDWLSLPNLEGVVAKRVDRPYAPGRCRDWIKVKRQRTVDCVVVGVACETTTPKLVLALRHADGNLHHFAVTRPLAPELAAP